MAVVAGSEFTVNSSAADAGFSVSVAGHADGSFIVSWVALTEPIVDDDSRNSYDILARTYAGTKPLSDDLIVNAEQRDGQFSPQAVARDDGSYVIAYKSGEENRLYGSYAASQVLGRAGDRIGDEQFGDYSYYHNLPDVAVLGGGRYVVVSAEEQEGEAQLHAADGTITNVFDFGYLDGSQVGVTSLAGSRYLLLWHGYSSPETADGEDGPTSPNALYGRVQSADGAAGTPFVITEAGTVNGPTARLLDDGRAVVVWSGDGDVRFSLVDAASGTASAATSVGTPGASSGGAVAVLGNGDFVISWTDGSGADGSGAGIEAQLFHGDGSAAGAAFVVNQRTAGDQVGASVAAVGTEGFVVGWQGADGIQARLFNDAGAGGPISPLFTRAGTIDLSPSANQVVTGAAGANSFYVDSGQVSGRDRITNFGKADVLLTTVALTDNNHDGIVTFGRNGVLDLGGADAGGDSIRFDGGVKAVRALGQSDGLFVYGDAGVRPGGAIEGTLANDLLKGDAAGLRADVFFFDTALGVSFGQDRVASFGVSDILVTTTKIADANGDGVVTFGSNNLLDIGNTQVGMSDVKGKAILSLEYDGAVQHGGETYFVYSLPGSTAGVSSLHF